MSKEKMNPKQVIEYLNDIHVEICDHLAFASADPEGLFNDLREELTEVRNNVASVIRSLNADPIHTGDQNQYDDSLDWMQNLAAQLVNWETLTDSLSIKQSWKYGIVTSIRNSNKLVAKQLERLINQGHSDQQNLVFTKIEQVRILVQEMYENEEDLLDKQTLTLLDDVVYKQKEKLKQYTL